MVEMNIWRKAWALLDAREKRYAFVTLGVVIVGALSSALMVGSIMPFLSVLAEPSRIETQPMLAWAYERFGFQSAYEFLAALGLASFVVIVLASAVQIAKTYAVFRFSMMRMHTISYRLMHKYLHQPYEFFLNRHSGELGTRILAESRELVLQFLRPAAELVAAVATVLAIVALLLWIDPVVSSIVFLVLGALYGGIYTLTRQYLKRIGKDRVTSNSERYRITTEAFGGIKAIKLLGREANYLKRYAGVSSRMARIEMLVQTISAVPQFALQAFALGGVILLCVVLLDPGAREGQMGLEGILPLLGVLAFAGQRLMPELSRIYQSLTKIQASSAAVDIVYGDLVTTDEGQSLECTSDRIRLKQSIELDHVSYRYPSAENVGLHDINLKISVGERIGIVGTTGAGKTTLADIILGLLPPGSGEMRVDNIKIMEENIRAWQQNVGYVPQDIFLTDASVAENIALGLAPEEIDSEKVEESARIARLDGFIRKELPKGYDTIVGERGVRLSGGQRQRIGIARALYTDADLIVFDEATSALDNLTEQEVMAAIDALPGDKTILVIAHRLSTVQHCDRIVVLDKGRIVGCDNWEALMAGNPFFQRIAKATQSVA